MAMPRGAAKHDGHGGSSVNLQAIAKIDDMLSVPHFCEASKAVGGRGGSRLHLHDDFGDNSAARRLCGPILPGEASAADTRESIQCERTPAAVIGRRQEQRWRCFRQVLERKMSRSSS